MILYQFTNDFCIFEEILIKNIFKVAIKDSLKTQWAEWYHRLMTSSKIKTNPVITGKLTFWYFHNYFTEVFMQNILFSALLYNGSSYVYFPKDALGVCRQVTTGFYKEVSKGGSSKCNFYLLLV